MNLNTKILTKEETYNLFKIMHEKIDNNVPLEDIKERTILIQKNESLIKKIISSSYYNYLDEDELLMIGKINLIKAVDTYDYTYNNSFSTYAYKVIDNGIKQELTSHNNDNRVVNKHIVSFETPLYGEEGGEELLLKDTLEDPDSKKSENDFIDKEFILNLLQYLTPIEQFCIISFFKLFNYNLTNKETISILKVTNQRYMQIKDTAIKKLILINKNESKLSEEERDILNNIKSKTYKVIKNVTDIIPVKQKKTASISNINLEKNKNKHNKKLSILIEPLNALNDNLKRLNTLQFNKPAFLNACTPYLKLFIDDSFKELKFTLARKNEILSICKFYFLKSYNKFYNCNYEEFVNNLIDEFSDNLITCLTNHETYNTALKKANELFFNTKQINLQIEKILTSTNKSDSNLKAIFMHLKPIEQLVLIYKYKAFNKFVSIEDLNDFIKSNKLKVAIEAYLHEATSKIDILLKPEINCTYAELIQKEKLKAINYSLILNETFIQNLSSDSDKIVTCTRKSNNSLTAYLKYLTPIEQIVYLYYNKLNPNISLNTIKMCAKINRYSPYLNKYIQSSNYKMELLLKADTKCTNEELKIIKKIMQTTYPLIDENQIEELNKRSYNEK